jgi:hypothetical protein
LLPTNVPKISNSTKQASFQQYSKSFLYKQINQDNKSKKETNKLVCKCGKEAQTQQTSEIKRSRLIFINKRSFQGALQFASPFSGPTNCALFDPLDLCEDL